MTRVVDGYAQPDIDAYKGRERLVYFVETRETLATSAPAIVKSMAWLKENDYGTQTKIVVVKPTGKKGKP